jgi:hypothetical protein
MLLYALYPHILYMAHTKTKVDPRPSLYLPTPSLLRRRPILNLQLRNLLDHLPQLHITILSKPRDLLDILLRHLIHLLIIPFYLGQCPRRHRKSYVFGSIDEF